MLVRKILRKFDMHILQIYPPKLSDVATIRYLGNPKTHFSTELFVYTHNVVNTCHIH